MKKSTKRSAKKDDTAKRSGSAAQVGTNDVTNFRWCVAIVIFAFALRLIYLFQIEPIPLFYNLAGDGRAYYEWGQRIAAGDWLGKGVFYQAPLYPYFLGVLQAIVGPNLWLIRLVQIALGALSCVLVFLVGQKLFLREAGIASSLILACYAPAIFFDALIEKSVVDLFLLSLLLLLLARSLDEKRWTQWLGMGVVVGLLGLSRENALILALIVPLWSALYFSREPLLARTRRVALFAAGLLLVLVPVGLRNLSVGGEFKLTTAQFGPNFFIGNNPVADGTYGSVRKAIGATQLEGPEAARLAEKAVGRELTAGEVSDYWFEKSWNYVLSTPAEWLRLLAKKWLMVWNAREVEDSDDFYIYQQWSWLLTLLGWLNHFGILTPFAAVGLWLTRQQWRRLWLLYVMTLSIALSVALFFVFGRYRFPLVPLLALFAGAGIVQLARLYKQQAWRQLIVAAAFLLASGVIVNWPIYAVRGPGPGGYNNLANAYYKQGKVNDAIQMATKSIQVQPDYGVAHYNLGNLYAAEGRFDLAQHHFEETLRLYPNYGEARSNLGLLLLQKGDPEAGIEQFRKALEINPDLGTTYLNLGAALIQQGRLDEAISPLQKVVELDPKSDRTHYYLGTIYASVGRYNDAANHFEEAIRIQANFPEAHESLARVLSLQGKKQEALQHFQEALRLTKQKQRAVGIQ
jgi:tetratricopeptide (TPR) repeat protein